MTSPANGRIRVMVVDDSAVVRGLLRRLLDQQADLEVVATASNGEMALAALRRHPADVVLLDIEMPVLDGLSAVPLIVREFPQVRIIMVSTLTHRGADATLRALSLGAADYVSKPTTMMGGKGLDRIAADLLAKIRALGDRRPRAPADRAYALHPQPAFALPPRILVIGASTGGPNALEEMLSALPSAFSLPILIVQHMPPLFTSMLAQRLAVDTGRTSQEAVDGQPIEPGWIYVAPGDHHMVVRTSGVNRILRLNQDPPENFSRPSVDPLFRTAAQEYGAGVLAAVLTGMGEDGLKGSEAIVHHGGTVLAQDEATSVVWGMPRAVAQAGLATEVLPLREIAPRIMRHSGVLIR